MQRNARRRDDLIIERLGEGCCVMDPVSEEVHVLNATACWLLHSLDGATPPDALAGELAEHVGIDVPRARGDVDACLRELEQLKLVER